MTDGFRVFPLPLQAIVLPQIRRQPFQSTSFQIHYSRFMRNSILHNLSCWKHPEEMTRVWLYCGTVGRAGMALSIE
jgi:hypothetical protein